VDARMRHEVGLELGPRSRDSAEAEGSRERGAHLCDEAVGVGVGWVLDVDIAATHIVKSLVIQSRRCDRGERGCRDSILRLDKVSSTGNLGAGYTANESLDSSASWGGATSLGSFTSGNALKRSTRGSPSGPGPGGG